VPRELCELNFCVSAAPRPLFFRATSNGLASGNTVTEALLHGLCEVVERDAAVRLEGAWRDPGHWVIPATVMSEPARRVLDRFARAGMVARVVDITGPTGLPTFEVLLGDGGGRAYCGRGCHPTSETALLRALTEAAQGRLAHIAGGRDDLRRRTYPGGEGRAESGPDPVAEGQPGRPFAGVPNLPARDAATTLRDVVRRVRHVTGVSPVGVDLRRPEFDLPVVFVFAPGLRLRPPE
jgi:ribosomal protein S12 methylthiotransferase accessory factor